MRLRVAISGLLLLAVPSLARAQTRQDYGAFKTLSNSGLRLAGDHWKLTGDVELETKDLKIFADEAELFLQEDRALLTGNVVMTQGVNRIAADRAEFNIKTRLGTFHNASGIVNLKPPVQRARPGVTAPPHGAGQETDVYFFGETVGK